MWRLVVLLSLGGFFEFYELFATGFILPGISRSGLLSPTTGGLLSLQGYASYIAATFAGLFVGSALFGQIADRYGRRATFMYAVLLYSVSAAAMSVQMRAPGLVFWRLMTGAGMGIELVTIDAYLIELVPASYRGRAFAISHVIGFLAVPAAAFLAWRVVPLAPFGIDGWRWVVMAGSVGGSSSSYCAATCRKVPAG